MANPFMNFISAIRNGHVGTVRLLLNNPLVDPTAGSNFAFELACREGHLDIVRLLLADGRVNPAANNNDAIILASRQGHLDIVRLLLADARVNPADQNNTAFELACREGHLDVVRLLLADQRVNPISSYHIAVTRMNQELIELLRQDLRIAMFLNDPVLIQRAVDLHPRPPRNSLVYTLGNRDSRILLNKLYTDKAILLAKLVPRDLARIIQQYQYGKKKKSTKKRLSKKRKA